MLVAGEPSGDALGGRLMAALKQLAGGEIEFIGVGGPRMAAEGLDSLFPMQELSLMGAFEILPRAPALLRRLRQTVEAALTARPDILVTIDAPAFNFKVARRLKGKGIPLVHYVAPSVWAWRPGRARVIARFLDHLLALLPFEPPYFDKVGLPCTFVGHPVVEGGADKGNGAAFRERHNIPRDAPVLCLLPGSRGGEVSRLLPVFARAIPLLQEKIPGLYVVVVAVPNVAVQVAATTSQWSNSVLVNEGEEEKYDAFAASTGALAASGTVSLELALAGVPAVITYRMNPLTMAMARLLVRLDSVNLVNIIYGSKIVPEFLQEQCRPELLAAAVTNILTDPAARAAQSAAMTMVSKALGAGGAPPSIRAAEVVLRIMKERAVLSS
jgi:lipid-A-disaccharide synthase